MHVEDWNPDGRGRGRLGKRIALVSQAFPGERVLLRPDGSTKNVTWGRVATLLEASPRRQDTPCPHEFACTGCQFLGLSPEAEAAFKITRLRDALRDLDLNASRIEAMQRPSELYGYRHYAKLAVGRQDERLVFGSYVAGTHELADNSGCSVLHPQLARIIEVLRATLEPLKLPVHVEGGQPGLRHVLARRSRKEERVLVALALSDPEPVEALRSALTPLVEEEPELAGVVLRHNPSRGNALLEGETLAVLGREALSEELLGFEHRLGVETFFQINPTSATFLFERTLEGCGRGERLLELHAGVGVLTRPLLERFARVTTLEAAPASVAAARSWGHEAETAGRLRIVEGRSEDHLARLLEEEAPDTVLCDPPRKGLGAEQALQIAESSAKRVVLLSCDPSTLARDLPPFLAGGWTLRRLVPVDQFPRTAHFETLTLLERTRP